MNVPLLTLELRHEQDLVICRQRTRHIAEMLGFQPLDQTKICTSVSEIGRNAVQYAGSGKVQFAICSSAVPSLQIQVQDNGPGIENVQEILDGQFTSQTGMGLGIVGTRRLMDGFRIESLPRKGTTVFLEKKLPEGSSQKSVDDLIKIISQWRSEKSATPFEELQKQNQDLLTALADLEKYRNDLETLNRELEDTNRGVVALYAELDEKAEYLRRASDLKSRFLSNMTHEFRTPLNSILSLSRMLLDRLDGELSREQEKQVGFIQKAANDLSELVNDLLDLAKVESGKMTLRPTEFRAGDIFGALRGMLRPLLSFNSSVTLVFEDPQNIPPLFTDEARVSQILRNFISNALKFTERGEIRVSARLRENDLVEFSVADAGIGISKVDQKRIFDEFVQVEGPHQSKFKGTGLGLPITKKLAELLGGTVSVDSQPGIGSTFSVIIPRSYVATAGMLGGIGPNRELDSTKVPVLIIEDNQETQYINEKYLKGTCFQPIAARTTREARLVLEQCRPIAIVMDILLEKETSWNLLIELKSRPDTKSIPIYVVTVLDHRERAFSYGADDFFIKPLPREWLLEKLKGLLKEKPLEKLLIIDDDEISRYVLKGFLQETCFSILEASSGPEGIKLARKLRPRAIFLDLLMPEMDGFEVLERLRSDPATQEIPVIVHSTKPLEDAEKERLESAGVVILEKKHSDRHASASRIHEALLKAQVSVRR